jgi:hypothetical protein
LIFAFSCCPVFFLGKFPAMTVRVNIVVEGRVQRVGFRFECSRLAAQFGLRGWPPAIGFQYIRAGDSGTEAEKKVKETRALYVTKRSGKRRRVCSDKNNYS